MKLKIILCFYLILCLSISVSAQDSTVIIYKKFLRSKEQIMAGVTVGISPMKFVEKDFRIGNFKNITYNSQWLTFTYGMGEMLHVDQFNRVDTVALKEMTFGANFTFKKLAVGRRLYDMRGILMVPSLSAAIGTRSVIDQSSTIAKVTPAISLQFPFFAIDFKAHAAFDIKNSITGINKFSLIPEIGIKIDGLYNLMDAQRVYMGTAKGELEFKYRKGHKIVEHTDNYIITTTYVYGPVITTLVPYEFSRNTTIIGPLAAFGPHFSFQNQPYAGPTRMYGLGYYLRYGILASDFVVDKGKIGFGSSMKNPRTFENLSPRNLDGVNKKDFSNRGYYDATRFQVRVGLDIFELFLGNLAVGRGQTKFTRVIGGIGYGYALISKPHYISADGLSRADDKFNTDLSLLTSSGNHAKFGKSGSYGSAYFSIEAGAISLTFETNRYFNSALANTSSITVGYLFPYNRMLKKMKAIKSYKKYIRENS